MFAAIISLLLVAAPTNRIQQTTPARTIPPNGWAAKGVPGGRILPLDVTKVNESQLLRKGAGVIYPIADGPLAYHRERVPVIIVHGIRGSPGDLQSVVDRLHKLPGFQLYAFAYESWKRRTTLAGGDLAAELRTLNAALGQHRELVIVAHSMGGLVSRWALDQLALKRDTAKWKRIRLVTADTPWHGYGGPSDQGIEGVFMDIARPFMPDALEDMRAKSAMFVGDPKSKDPLLHGGIYAPVPPENTEIDITFADNSKEVNDYTEGDLTQLAGKLAVYYKTEQKVDGSQQLINFWRALISGTAYYKFQDQMRGFADVDQLDAAKVTQALLADYPRYPGTHMGVLQEHPGQRCWLDHVEELLLKK